MAADTADGDPMDRGWSLFAIRGIRVRLDPSWLLIFALILASISFGSLPRAVPDRPWPDYLAAGAVATLLFFLSILAHELAHAFAAQRAGIRVPAITLFLFGGVSHMERETTTPRDELQVAAVGPLTSFALAGGFWLLDRALAGGPALAGAVAHYLAWINAALGVFNLLPGLPLDGGRVLRAIAWWRTGSLRRATRIASNAGKGLALGVVLLGAVQLFSGAVLGGMWLILIGMFLRNLAEASYQGMVLSQSLEDVKVRDVALRDPVTVPPDLTIRKLVDEYLLTRGHRSYPVVEGGLPIGLIALEDLRGTPVEQQETLTVRDRMRRLDQVSTVSPDLPLADALRKLGGPTGSLLVLRDGRLEGLLTKSALLRFVEIRHVLAEA